MLKTTNISAGYQKDANVIHNISLEIPEGRCTAIIGPNGSGKSTLLRVVAGLLKPDVGEIELCGKLLTEFSLRERSKRLSFFPQQRPIPKMTAMELVLHGRLPHKGFFERIGDNDRGIARDALEQVSALEFSGKYLENLSGGQLQRAYLAMMLAQKTPLMLLDEPTAFLDISSRLGLLATLKSLRGKTVVAVLHQLDEALKWADHIIMMKEGHLIAQTTAGDASLVVLIKESFGVESQLFYDDTGELFWCFKPIVD